MKFPSRNIIFFDSEFSSNDPATGEILSLGMIKPSGEELYLELEYSGEVSPFVKSHVLPFLNQPKVTKEEAKKRIIEFAGDQKPTLVTFVNQFDFVYLTKIIPYSELPFSTIPIDFASVLFGIGIDPNDFKEKNGYKLLKELGIDIAKYQIHYALDDSRLLRDVFQKLIESNV
jgi:hypothetical protein